MKHTEAPICPRCNRNNEVRKIALELADMNGPHRAVRDGYILEGTVIRPDSSDWYCNSCSETFGAARVHWGKFLTDRPQ
jgi:ribosomal protein L37AE/L43A